MKYRKKPVVVDAYQTDKEMVIHTLEGDMRASVGDYIITGVNGEQYPCKPDIFEKTYEPEIFDGIFQFEGGMSFGFAIEAAKRGLKIARKGWNGKNQHIELATSISYTNREGKIINAEHDAIGNCALAFVGTSGIQMGWLASQADMLADDWIIVK